MNGNRTKEIRRKQDRKEDKKLEKDRSEGIRNIGGIGNGSEVKTGTGLNTMSNSTTS